MIRILFLGLILVGIFYVLKKRSNSNIYGRLIFLTVVAVILFIVATSGKLVVPYILQILKIGLPLVTKFIGL